MTWPRVFLLPLVAFVVGAPPSAAAPARAVFRFDALHLARLGLEVVGARDAVGTDLAFEGEMHGDPGGGEFAVSLRGGFSWRAFDPRTGEARAPLCQYDASLEFDLDARAVGRVRVGDVIPLEIRNTAIRSGPQGKAELRAGDVFVTEAWALRLNEPLLAGRWLGSFDLWLAADVEKSTRPAPIPHDRFLDVALGELFEVQEVGRSGTYPTGTTALSAATTSCNLGTVDVPWERPMGENHPFIGLALFRVDADGILEQLGRNWIKHGFYATSQSDCRACLHVSPQGTFLGVGCSDTYSAAHNGFTPWLGPREEVNPYTAAWTACGSFFDGDPVDCARSYNGTADPVFGRLAVYDGDLAQPGAKFFYEGAYFVAGDEDNTNNVGWRECTAIWTGASWALTTVIEDPGSPDVPNVGPVVLSWGDRQDARTVAAGDGEVMLSVQVTDRGGGSWHYEYALYNRNSDRGIRSFSIPVGTAEVTNVGFRDLDRDGGTDWAFSRAGGMLTWATDEYATDPDAPALTYQSMYNFRFDADRPAEAASASGGLFKPGPGTTVILATRAPAGAPPRAATASAVSLSPNEPNPFSGTTRIRFSVGRPGPVRLSVLDVSGRTIRVLLAGQVPAGTSRAHWDGRDAGGARVASGVYFFRLQAGEEFRTTRALHLR